MTRTMVRSWLQLVVAVALVAYAALARADGNLELGVATGYTGGHGPAAGGMMPELQDLAGNGGAVRVEVGWRIDPHWMVGPYVEVARLARGASGTDGTTSAAVGLQAQYHVAPARRLDPWLGAGLGWRGLWLDHAAGTHAMQGLDLARVELGVDYRVSDRLAVGPTIGLAFTRLLSEQAPGASGYSRLEDRETGHFLFAGVTGRFDVLGE